MSLFSNVSEEDEKPVIKLIKLNSYKESSKVLDLINNNSAVILNLTALKDVELIKAYEFITGGCYRANAKVIELASNIYLLMPETFEFINTQKLDQAPKPKELKPLDVSAKDDKHKWTPDTNLNITFPGYERKSDTNPKIKFPDHK